jgi:hypothetical protein
MRAIGNRTLEPQSHPGEESALQVVPEVVLADAPNEKASRMSRCMEHLQACGRKRSLYSIWIASA